MVICRNKELFIESADKKLLNTELSFLTIEKGKAVFVGEYNYKKVRVVIRNDYSSSYYFDNKEKIIDIFDNDYVSINVNKEFIFNTFI